MAIKFLAISAALAALILTPLHRHFNDPELVKPSTLLLQRRTARQSGRLTADEPVTDQNDLYLWVCVGFVYIFSGLAFFFLYTHTLRVIRVRQNYLGHQCTITDRTIRLSGIPPDMRTEESIRSHIEKMGIGTVESVTICRDWKELDHLIRQRDILLRKLEESWTVYLNKKRMHRHLAGLPVTEPMLSPASDEEPLLNGQASSSFVTKKPKITLRYGFLKLRSKKVDAIDHYTMKLEALDIQIHEARKKEYRPTPLAFVTLNSVAAAVSASNLVLFLYYY